MKKFFQDWASLPNILTYVRMGAMFLVVFFFYLPWGWSHIVAALIFAMAALTDWVDGYLARTWKLKTSLGEFLDPLADKLLVSILLILMVHAYDNLAITIIAMIIISRELSVMALRGFLMNQTDNLKMGRFPVNVWGKIKTFLQLSGITWFLAFPPGQEGWLPSWWALIILAFAAAMTLWSAFLYGHALWLEETDSG